MKTSGTTKLLLITATLLTISTIATTAPSQTQPTPHTQIPENLLTRTIGGKPHGTHIGQLRHMSIAYQIASPLPFQNTYLTGFSYAERGGAFTLLSALLAATAVQPEIGLELAFTLAPQDIASLGILIEFLSTDKDTHGRQPFHFTFKLNHTFALSHRSSTHDKLPITMSWGIQLKLWALPDPIPHTESFTDGSFGLPIEFAFPLTRWAQIDFSLTPSIGFPIVEIAAGATFHLGNRFFVATGSNYTLHHFGPFLRAGLRL